MLRICISGFTDSGKTSLGEELAKDLNIIHITKYPTDAYKKFKEEEGGLDEDSRIRQTANKNNAKAFDEEIAQMAEKTNCVVTTWIGPWIVKNPTLRIWLNASFEERVTRCAKERKLTAEEALNYVKKKDQLNSVVFKELYNIDINDHSKFDMEINNEKLDVGEVASIVSMLAMMKEKSEFR